ncbi:MAG: glycosyltransferase [Methylococcaceae bacterium]|nr:glycosyltransferase [Methylococcaceae bacterium]
MTLVSILIPVFNREKIISETLDSALSQTYSNIEVIVVDNNSMDNTWRVIQQYANKDKRVKAFRNETNIGPVKNWKRCIDEATGEFGKILWSDDLIAPEFLEKTLPLLTDDVGFVYSGVKIFADIPENGIKHYFIGKSGIYSTNKFINYALYDKGAPFSPGCAVFRLDDLKNNLLVDVPNKINSDFSMHAIGNDLLIFLLTALGYKKFGFVSESLSFFRAHDGSISESSKIGKLFLYYALAKAYFVDEYLPTERRNFASYVQMLLWRYKYSKEYGLNQVDDFFKEPVKLSPGWFILYISKKISQYPRFGLNRIFGN